MGEAINWLVDQVGWPFPTWVAQELYDAEFKKSDVEKTGNALIEMFHGLQAKIEKALATDAADKRRVDFEYWRKPTPTATKEKPIKLKATLYKHPDYGKVWMLVETA